MIKLANYGVHFREWLKTRTWWKPQEVEFTYRLMGQLLELAQHFMLPQGGKILEVDGTLHAKYAPLLFLPYPVVAFEFVEGHIDDGSPLPLGVGIPTRRMAICLDHQASAAIQLCPMDEDEFGCISFSYFERAQYWQIEPIVNIVGRNRVTEITEETLNEAKTESSRIDAMVGRDESLTKFAKIGTPMLDVRHVCLPGFDENRRTAYQDSARASLVASVQACAALNCANVAAKEIQASSVINERRRRNGKIPFDSYHILEVASSPAGAGDGNGTHAPPRQHLRRGHIRRLSVERHVWVNSCVVGKSELGVVTKDYRVGGLT